MAFSGVIIWQVFCLISFFISGLFWKECLRLSDAVPASSTAAERRRAEGTTEDWCCDAIYWSTSCLRSAALLHCCTQSPPAQNRPSNRKIQPQEAVMVNVSNNALSEKANCKSKLNLTGVINLLWLKKKQKKNTFILLHYWHFYGLRVYSKIIFIKLKQILHFHSSKIFNNTNLFNL